MSATRRQQGFWPVGVGFYGLLGAVLVIAGGLLPWLSTGKKTLSAWSIPVLALVPGAPLAGPPIGAILLVAVLALLPYVIRRPLPVLVRLLLAGVAINAAVTILVGVVRAGPQVSLGLGVLLTLAGGVLLIVGEAGMRRTRGGSN
jgi:hypothetical protein